MTALALPRLALSGELNVIGRRLLAVVALCILLSFMSGPFFTSS